MSSPELVPVGRGFDTSLGYLAGAEDHWTQRGSGTVCDGTEPVDLLHNGEPAIGMNGTGFGGCTSPFSAAPFPQPFFRGLSLLDPICCAQTTGGRKR